MVNGDKRALTLGLILLLLGNELFFTYNNSVVIVIIVSYIIVMLMGVSGFGTVDQVGVASVYW